MLQDDTSAMVSSLWAPLDSRDVVILSEHNERIYTWITDNDSLSQAHHSDAFKKLMKHYADEAVCADGLCDVAEDCTSCSADCGTCGVAFCGDNLCEGLEGESCMTCAECDTLDPVCGNGACDPAESSTSCYDDCGPAPWPSAWAAWETEAVTLVNQHRAAGTDCPTEVKDPVGPVSMDSALQRMAQLHSWDESNSGYLGPTSCNDRSLADRAAAQGTTAAAEIRGFSDTPQAAVDGWLASSSCNSLMNGSYTRVGFGFADPGFSVWTGAFGE